MVTTKLNLSMTEPQVRQIYAKQGDTGRVLDITLDQTPEDGTLRILRPDGTEVTSDAVTGGEVSESGETVTFDSLTEADVTELTVGIEPVQDLNGYDKPWVGGAGKNKFDKDNPNIVNAYITANGLVQSNPDNRVVYVKVTPNSTVSVMFTQVALPTSTARDDVQAGVFSSEPIAGVTGTYKGTWRRTSATEDYTYSFSISVGDNDYVAIKIGNTQRTDVTASLETLQIEYGTTATSYEPYSNICPITGHDEVTVYDDPVYGKTIKWNQLIQNGNFADTSKWGTWGGAITVSGNVATVTTPGQWNQLSQVFDWTYGHIMLARASVKKFGESGNVAVKVVNDFAYSNQQFAKGIATNDVWTDVVFCGTYTKTPSDSTAQVRFGVQEYRPSNSNNGFQIKNVGVFDLTEMFGEGNEPTIEEFEALFPKDYYPYNTGEETTVSAVNGDPNRQYTASLGQTVYGGTLDLVSGVLTVDKAIVDLGSLSWSMSGSGNTAFFYANTASLGVASDITTSLNYICENYSIVAVSSGGTATGMAFTSASQLRIRDATYSDATSFKTAMNGVQLVYQLATPVEYQLTPQQIKTLVGTNNVWASSGDIVNITFTYGGLLSELPSDATSIVGKCYCDVEQNGVSSMPFTLNVKKNERES